MFLSPGFGASKDFSPARLVTQANAVDIDCQLLKLQIPGSSLVETHYLGWGFISYVINTHLIYIEIYESYLYTFGWMDSLV